MGHLKGPTSKIDMVIMDLDAALPTPNKVTMGQASSQADVLFSLGPHIPRPPCEAKMR